jgi:hypothetical protein
LGDAAVEEVAANNDGFHAFMSLQATCLSWCT